MSTRTVRGIPLQQVLEDGYAPECCKWKSLTTEPFEIQQVYGHFYWITRRDSLEEAVDDVVRYRKLRIASLARSIETYEGPEK